MAGESHLHYTESVFVLIFQSLSGLCTRGLLVCRRAYARLDWPIHSRLIVGEFQLDHLELMLVVICKGTSGLRQESYI